MASAKQDAALDAVAVTLAVGFQDSSVALVAIGERLGALRACLHACALQDPAAMHLLAQWDSALEADAIAAITAGIACGLRATSFAAWCSSTRPSGSACRASTSGTSRRAGRRGGGIVSARRWLPHPMATKCSGSS